MTSRKSSALNSVLVENRGIFTIRVNNEGGVVRCLGLGVQGPWGKGRKENLLFYRDLNLIRTILLMKIDLFQTILKKINSNIR
jgi:hypothetical protein